MTTPEDEPEGNRMSTQNTVASGKNTRNRSTDGTNRENEKKPDRVYYSTGRGGAGNIASSSTKPSPKLVAQGSGTPKLHTAKVSTGRGGFGNMIKNNDPELTRKIQDVDGPSNSAKENELYAVASNKSFSIGRGGFGNVISRQTSGADKNENANEHKLITMSSHGLQKSEKKKGFLYKIKELFQG